MKFKPKANANTKYWKFLLTDLSRRPETLNNADPCDVAKSKMKKFGTGLVYSEILFTKYELAFTKAR